MSFIDKQLLPSTLLSVSGAVYSNAEQTAAPPNTAHHLVSNGSQALTSPP